MRVLVLCTANICRSPMAERLLRHQAAARGLADAVTVASAGFLTEGRAASEGSVRALARLGLDLDGHASQIVTADLLSASDLVLTMETRHVRDATVVAPDRFTAIYTVRELVQRAEPVGPRGDRPLDDWLADVGADRDPAALIGATDLDTADPYGGPDEGYLRTAAELVELTETIAAMVWGPAPEGAPPPLDVSLLAADAPAGAGAAVRGWWPWRRRGTTPPA